MQHRAFQRRILSVIQLLFIFSCAFFSLWADALAAGQCPQVDSPGAVALEFQLFSAFSIGYNGYEAPCEIQCMGRESCQNRCQEKKGLESLASKMDEFQKPEAFGDCPTLKLVCQKQCLQLGASCESTCQISGAVAKK